ncbi:hypothetical protein EMIT0P176_30170 [Pseudomonas sp. IT-P176]
MPEHAAHRTGDASPGVVAEQVQRRCLALGLGGAAADPAAGHRVCAEEAEGEDQHADDHQWQRAEHGHGQPAKHQHDGAPEHLAPTQAIGQGADLRRTVDARQVHHRQQADQGLVHVVRRGQQAIADVVEQRDEGAHQHKGFEEQQRQAGVAKMHGEAIEQAAWVQRARAEVARFGEDLPEHRRGDQRQPANHQHRRVPADEVDQHPDYQSAAHAAYGVAADVQAHCQADVLWVDLFTEVGHRHRRQAAQGQAGQRAHQQDALPGRHQGAAQGAQRGGEQRCDHHRFSADAVGQGAGDQQADGEHAGGHRENQAALRGVDRELMGKQRHHRLHAVQQGKGGEAAAEQREHRAQEHRRTFFDVHLMQLGDPGGLCGRRKIMGEWRNSSFHGGPQECTAGQAMKKAYSWLMFLSNILFDLFKMFYDLMEFSWNCAICATLSPSPKNCISAARHRCWASPSRH